VNPNWNREIWTEWAHPGPAIDERLYRHWGAVPYNDDESDEMRIISLSCPRNKKDFPSVVWFHGGGFTGGGRECPPVLYEGKCAVAEVRYRLSPHVKAPAYHEDGTAALAWVLSHIAELGGDPRKVFVGGMSAGAYLAAIISMDKRWLAPHGFSYHDLAGLLLISGQMSTHFKVKEDLHIPGETYAPVIDSLAPLAHLSADLPPILLVTGDPACDMPARPEENAYTAASLRALGHQRVEHYQLNGHCHGGAFRSCDYLVEKFVNTYS
jgi:acetyl esterase/lipase